MAASVSASKKNPLNHPKKHALMNFLAQQIDVWNWRIYNTFLYI